MESSIELLKKLKDGEGKVNPLLDDKGIATEFLLDLTRGELREILKGHLKKCPGEFDLEILTDRIWRHRNFALQQGRCSDGSFSELQLERFVDPDAELDQSRKEAAEELFEALRCSGGHANPTDHDKNTPICGNVVVAHCNLTLRTLSTKWTNFTKDSKCLAFKHQSGPSLARKLTSDFEEKELLDFLKIKQQQAKRFRLVLEPV